MQNHSFVCMLIWRSTLVVLKWLAFQFAKGAVYKDRSPGLVVEDAQIC